MRLHMRRRRKELGLTQEEVAKMAGLTRSHYTKIENGVRGTNLDQMIRIAKALNIHLDLSFFANFCDKTGHKGDETNETSRKNRHPA